MTLTLTNEQEELVRQATEWRGFPSPEAFIEDALGEIVERESYLHNHRSEITAIIDESWNEAQRGELLTPEEVKQQIAEVKRDFLANR